MSRTENVELTVLCLIEDGSNASIWHTSRAAAAPLEQRYITLELKNAAYVGRYEYQPNIGGANGRVNQYRISVSLDDQSWTTFSTGSWANDGALKTAEFTPVLAKNVGNSQSYPYFHTDFLRLTH